MKLKHVLLAALTLVCGLASAQMQMPAIPMDTAVRMGKLPNGLTYYIRYNNWPEHRANFYIAQKVGSIQEEESQRGLAHFLEHMAFNGSDHFQGNDLIEWCRAHGIEFGGDLNAYTSIDQTVYNINNVPTQNQGVLDSCLLILRDWSTGLTLDPKEIDKERGVIHEEWRMRTSASSRMLERNLPALYPGSKYGLRYPIGLMSVIDNFKPKELVDYYHKWYHPDHQGIIIVGDVNVDKTEAEIKKLFGGIQNPANEAPIIDELVPDNDTAIVIVDKDKEYETSDINIMMKHDVFPDSLKNSPAYLIYNYVKNAACTMLNNRYTEAAQDADCPYVNAGAYDGNYIYAKTKGAFSISAMPKDSSKIEASLTSALIEARRAAEFGFTPTEYKRFQADYLSALDKQYSNRDKRTNGQLYSQILANFLENAPLPSIEYSYEMMKQIVPMIPVEAVNEFMSELVTRSDTNLVIINFNNEKEGSRYPTRQSLLAAVKTAHDAQLTAYVDNVKDEPIMQSVPKAGKIVKEEKNDKFGYTTLTLSNGVKVTLKKTDYKKDQVILQGRGGAGSSVYNWKQDAANIKLFDDAIEASGLGSFSHTELEKALAGKIASAGISMDSKYMALSGSSTPTDARTMFQLAYLTFTDIAKDQKSFDNMIQQQAVSIKNRNLDPSTAFSDSLTATLYGHNQRLEPLNNNDLKNVSYDRILAMAKERTANARGWDFTVIGNFDEDSVRLYVCEYLGSLPSQKKAEKGKRLEFFQKGVNINHFTRKMETPKANAIFVWSNQDMPYSLEHSIQANIAGQILSMEYLQKIREDASAAYSCGAQGGMSVNEDYHIANILAFCPMKPEKKDIALKILGDEVPALINNIDAEKLDKVKKLMTKQFDTTEKSNGFWLGVLNQWRRYGIDEYTDYKKLVEAQTPDKIKAFMKEFLKPGDRSEVVMMPQDIE